MGTGFSEFCRFFPKSIQFTDWEVPGETILSEQSGILPHRSSPAVEWTINFWGLPPIPMLSSRCFHRQPFLHFLPKESPLCDSFAGNTSPRLLNHRRTIKRLFCRWIIGHQPPRSSTGVSMHDSRPTEFHTKDSVRPDTQTVRDD